MVSFERTSSIGGRAARNVNGKSKPPATPRKDPLASLRLASMLDLKPTLPLELIAQIVDFLEIPDMFRLARVSRKVCEIVYDQSRWVGRLRRLGVWDEEAARRLEEQSVRRPSTVVTQGHLGGRNISQWVAPGAQTTTPENKGRPRSHLISPLKDDKDGFDAVNLGSSKDQASSGGGGRQLPFMVFSQMHFSRRLARQEYGQIYQVLGPYYNDLCHQLQPMDTIIFKNYASPEEQAQILSILRTFAKSDIAVGAAVRKERLSGAVSVFEAAALQELRIGYQKGDIQGQMKRYANVLSALDASQHITEFFIQNSNLIVQKSSYGDPADYLDDSSGRGSISLEKTQVFFNRLGVALVEENGVIENAFPNAATVKIAYIGAIGKEVLNPYLTVLFDRAHSRGNETYLKTIAGSFAQTRRLFEEISWDEDDEASASALRDTMKAIFEHYLESYLGAELEYFEENANAKVDSWNKALLEQVASTEIFLMSNLERQAEKKDFLSSFKKAVMMPVNILPSFPSLSNNKATAKALVNGEKIAGGHSTPSNPYLSQMPIRTATPLQEAPRNELAAKAAIMSSKLEGIRSLFSIEVALDIVHAAKSSLERAAQFVRLGGELGVSARTQCSAIFVSLIYILGTRHVKAGFDQAVSHLAKYNPREIESQNSEKTRAQPLTTFLELVNISDLIQQMLDVFYEQELVGPPLSLDRSDFTATAVKEKKKFEQMLDERVAAGLSKGIDVLMDEVEYTCATTQMPDDFNVPDTGQITDVGTTETAKQVIRLVSGHTSMLVGSTDKSLLDVFNGEVGVRLFANLCKHLKRQRISTLGSLRLIADMNAYYAYIQTLKNADLLMYFGALRELGQIYLIDEQDAADIAGVIADGDRWRGVFRAEEILEFAERRADWFTVKARVERGLYGQGCLLM